jgi:amino acid adenylation domain-containing protein
LENRLSALSNEKRRQLLERIQKRATSAGTQAAIPCRPDRAVAPLSFSQQRLWFLDQLDPATAAYNCPQAVRMKGRLDRGALERTLTEIVRRHESLRTVFRKVGDQVMQVIEPAGSLPVPVIDLTHLPPGQREPRARDLAVEEASAGFDLAAGPLFRASLLVLSETDHVLLITMHHIISDGWSSGILGREFATLYTAYVTGQPAQLPDLPIQYGDYALWQRTPAQMEALERQLAYWKQQLAGVPVLQLPTDRPRPAKLSYRGATEHLVVPLDRADALRATSRREGVTLFMTLLAAFQTLLCRYTGQEDIGIGTPVANRSRVETEGLIGFFVNMVVMRTDLSGNPTFRELLGRVRDVTLGAFANQELPFERLIDEMRVERSMSYSPLFQVILTLQNTPGQETVLPDLTLGGLPSPTGTTKLDMDLSISEKETGLVCELTYSTDLFDAPTIKRMLGHFDTLLKAILADPGQPISDLPLLTAAEQQRLLVDWNQTASNYPRELAAHQWIERQAEGTPERAAAVYAGECLTYRELNRRANQLAHYLREQGAGPGALVGICVERSPEMLIGLLAVLKAGAAYIPIDPTYPQERIAYMLTAAKAPLLLTQERLVPALPASGARLIPLDREVTAWSDRSDANPNLPVSPQDLAYVIFTSGTTGKPKGVMVEHRNIVAYVHAFTREFGPMADQAVLQLASFSFDTFVEEVFATLAGGGKLVIPEGMEFLNMEHFARLVKTHGVTQVSAPPLLLAEINEVPGLDSVRTWISGGDVLKPEHVTNLMKTARVYNTYGPTETTVCATYHRYTGEEPSRSIPLGRPIANWRVYILDPFGRPVPAGVAGELCVAGAGVARGYLNQDDLTRERFLPDPWFPGDRYYRTGDLARYLPNGEVEYLGRVDHQVKIRGFRVELGEIEGVLAEYPGIREAIVVAREDLPGGKQLVGYVVHTGGHSFDFAHLRQFLRQRLPEYMVPALFVSLPELPVNGNGKVDRSLLPMPEVSSHELFVAPSNPTEEVLAEIWSEVLGLEQVGVNDHFFALGGHSLLATRVFSRVRAALGVDLPVRSLFEAPTIADLAQKIQAVLQEQHGARAEPMGRADRSSPLPLSFAQQRLWFLDQMEPDTAAYNIPIAVRLTGRLDREAMERALREIVQRHETLRTSFPAVDGQPVQAIAAGVTLTLPVTDLRDLPGAQREARARELASEEARRPFCLTTGPVLRAGLLQLGAEEHVLLLTMHHIAADGWSMGVLVRELTTLYEAYLDGRPSPLTDLPIQYADYASWQRNWLQGEVLERQLDYWKQQLAGVPVLQLTTDYPRPAVQSFRGATQSLHLSKSLLDGLKALSRQAESTLFMTLTAAFQALLSRYTGQDDVSVGTPVANRNRMETEGLIGFFANTLVIRTSLAGNPSFRELLARVREVTLGAYTHQDVPFEKLVETVQPERSLSHHPLFQVLFALQNAPGAQAELPGLTLGGFPSDTKTAKFDLELSMGESDAGLEGEITYCTDLFDSATITRMIGHWQHLLEAIAANPDLRVADLPLLTPDEGQVLARWNETAAPYPPDACVHQLVEAQAERTPEAVAVAFGTESLTYRELNRRANQLAHDLRRRGVGPEVLVGVCVERSLEMVVALLAVLKAGGAYVPVDPAYPAERIAYMLADAQVPVLLTQARLAGRLAEAGAHLLVLDGTEQPWAGESDANPDSGVTAENLAYVIYTSGSTGKPKGVMNEHRGICNRLFWMQERYPLTPEDVVLQKTPYSFDVSVPEFFGTLLAGARLVMAEPGGHQDPAYLARVIQERGVTQCHFVPSMLQVFLDEPGLEESCRSLRRVLASGEALSYELQERFFRRLSADLLNLYGPTEAAVEVSYWPCERGGARRTVPIGYPVANVPLYVLDPAMQPVPVGVPGELYIGGVAVARGYWNRPELTAERFVPNPLGPGRLYRTGDRARWLPDGAIEYLGRLDYQVKVRGLRIELGEIEAVLAQHPSIREAVVLAREDQPGNQRLVAYLVPKAEAQVEVGDLRQFLQTTLPEYMVPAAFVPLPALPLTTSGKVDRRALPAPEVGQGVLFEAPRTATERALAEIWADLLKVERVGIHDNFFDLGGHSLLVTQLGSRIRTGLKADISLRQLFEGPTVAQMAEVVEQSRSRGEASPERPETPIRRTGVPALPERVDDLSEEELDQLLARLSAKKEGK